MEVVFFQNMLQMASAALEVDLYTCRKIVKLDSAELELDQMWFVKSFYETLHLIGNIPCERKKALTIYYTKKQQ